MRAPSMMRLLSALETEPIERVEEDGDSVRYTSMKVLGPGQWTDAESRETIWYSPEGIQNMDVDEDNVVNIMHDVDNEVSAVGRMDPNSAEADETGLYVDLVLDTSTAAGEYADQNLQQTLETGGAKGFGGPSVEIPPDGQVIELNREKGMPELKGGRLSGLGLVRDPAAKNTAFARETAQRPVALADGEDGRTPLVLRRRADPMQDVNPAVLANAIAKGLELQDVEFEREDRTLEIGKGVDTDRLQGFVEDVLGATVSEALGSMLEDADGGVELAADDIVAEEDDEEEEEVPPDDVEEGEGDDEEDDGLEMQGEEIVQAIQQLEERIGTLEDEHEALMQADDVEEKLEDATEDLQQDLADAETVEEIEQRLSAIEDEPQSARTLAEGRGEATDADDSWDEWVDAESGPAPSSNSLR